MENMQMEGIKYSFRNDYSEGAHPAVLRALTESNAVQTPGYGTDAYCAAARERIRALCDMPDAAVHFLMGGTQVNLVCCAAFLRPFEAVIAPCTGHPLVHETGALEATGHKIIAMPSGDGKLTDADVRAACDGHTDEHMVRPRMVYISNTTEVGTAYTKAELTALHTACRERDLILYLDGARLASGMVCDSAPLSWHDVASCTDAFTIGGTKNALLYGEALVITEPSLQDDFRFHMKQRGALAAKGRILGVQFDAILRDGLYLENARHANRLAQKLQAGIKAAGYAMSIETPSNQIFPLFPDAVLARLGALYEYEVQHRAADGMVCVRLVTSWATPEWAVDAFLEDLRSL